MSKYLWSEMSISEGELRWSSLKMKLEARLRWFGRTKASRRWMEEERRSSEEDAKDRIRRQKHFHKNSVINVYNFNLYFLASECIKLP